VVDTLSVLISTGVLPVYAHDGDAGADLHSNESVTLLPGSRVTVGTGVRIALPEGFVGFVVPRSGLAHRYGVTVLNSPGTVDAGYRGEIKITMLNTDTVHPFGIKAGDRIAQLVVMPVTRAEFVPVVSLPESSRGDRGFGSTGSEHVDTVEVGNAHE